MISNFQEVSNYFKKISNNNTIIFTNGNETYIPTLIRNLMYSYYRFNNEYKIGIFCSDNKAFEKAKEFSLDACLVDIPGLQVSEAYSSSAGSEFYLRLCFVKIILIKYALELNYDVLYIDPDMTFNLNCIDELVNNKDELTFSYYIEIPNSIPFLNSNIMRVYPTEQNKKLFDFKIEYLPYFLARLPDVGDENFLRENIFRLNITDTKSLKQNEYPAGGDSHYYDQNKIKMFHANCFVGLDNKINYLKKSNAWFI
jgi:hypothetical protein